MSNMLQNLFSKIIAFILAVISSLTGTLTEKPELAIKNDVNNTTPIIQVEIQNYTADDYVTFNICTLEKKVGETWVKMDYKEAYNPSTTAYIVSSRQTVLLTVDVINTFGTTLDVGDYRLSEELMLSKDYSKAIAKINDFKPDESLDADAKEAAIAEFKKATLDSVAKTAYSVEFSVKDASDKQ